MPFVGDMLRRERMKSGLDLDRISKETKIPARLLEAIEQEEFDKLPGRVFTISFVRQYAHTLGLDEDQVLADLRQQQAPPPPPRVAPAPEPPKRKSVQPIALGIAASVIVLLFAHAIWQRSEEGSSVAPEPPRSVVSSPLTAPAVSAPAVLPAARASQPIAAPQTMHLVLAARDASWILAQMNGHTVFAGVLKPNESKTLDGAGPFKLVVGNASAVDLSVNGKPAGPLGARGQTRDVQVTVPGTVQVAAHREPLEDIF